MIKQMFLSLAIILLVACSPHDENYYRMHPQILQTTYKNCPEESPPNLSCEKLAAIVSDVNNLAYSLQMNPQEFGANIMKLQVNLTTLQGEFEKNPKQVELGNSINSLKKQLQMRLAIVKWLESPES